MTDLIERLRKYGKDWRDRAALAVLQQKDASHG